MTVIARAPGKVVISGAYAVLEGAPALVAAVDRYAWADTSRTAHGTTPEVLAALGRGADAGARPRHPFFDASALRSGGPRDRKLGLGSSAAILVACLAALELEQEPKLDDRSLADRILRPALAAHRAAQGGGSGIDVAASVLGGTLRCRRAAGELETEPVSLPRSIVIEVWSSPDTSSTADMLKKVAMWKDGHRQSYIALMSDLSHAAAAAASAPDAATFIAACRAQRDELDRLGKLAGAPIVTTGMRDFDDAAKSEGAVVLPSGAGGGDIVLFIGVAGPEPRARAAGTCAGFEPLSVALGARGVHKNQREERHDNP
jgi:phosphomevalonate kinase